MLDIELVNSKDEVPLFYNKFNSLSNMIKLKLRTVIVIGMHRSGTSMISGILDKLGIDMGNYKKSGGIYNPLGYFEDQDFLNLNRKILKEAGGTWSEPPDEKSILSLQDKFSRPIQQLLTNKPRLWGWKDPRTSLTIKLYLKYIINPYVIVCHREPISVAKSLYNRYKTNPNKSVALKKIYEQRISNFLKENPKLKNLHLNYEDVILNPQDGINQIINFLDIKTTKNMRKNALEFILKPNKLKSKSKREKIKNKLRIFIKKRSKYLYYIYCYFNEHYIYFQERRTSSKKN